MESSEWERNSINSLFYIRGKNYVSFFLLTMVLVILGITGTVSGESNSTTVTDHGVTVVDATGLLDIPQIGDIALGQIPDERITVETTVVNNEKKDISGLRIRSFLVKNGREDTISMQLGSDFSNAQLKPGEVKSFKNNFMVSKQLKPGDYKIMIRIDSDVTSTDKKTDYTEFISNKIIKIGAYAEAGGASPVYSPNKIETPGSYLIMRDIDGGNRDNILKISCSGVTIDGGGHILRGSSTGYNSGIYVDGGTTIKDITIKNAIFEGVDFGVWLYKVEGASISNCVFRNCSNIGLRLDQTRVSSITDNRFEDNALGLGIFQSSGNSVSNNYFKNRFNAAANEEQRNIWNSEPTSGINILGGATKGGNAWFDLNGSGFSVTTVDSNNDGIADAPYSINGVNIDYYPLSVIKNPAQEVAQTPAPGSELNSDTGTSENKTITLETNNTSPQPSPEENESSELPVASSEAVIPSAIENEGADLIVLDVNTSTESTCLNGEIPISVTIGNIGSLEAKAFSIHYYLSYDTGITTSDRDVGSSQVDSLISQGNQTYSSIITLPEGIPLKYHTIGVIIDPANDIYEDDKQNNIGSSPQRIKITDCLT